MHSVEHENKDEGEIEGRLHIILEARVIVLTWRSLT
jgi:hypothetical protein